MVGRQWQQAERPKPFGILTSIDAAVDASSCSPIKAPQPRLPSLETLQQQRVYRIEPAPMPFRPRLPPVPFTPEAKPTTHIPKPLQTFTGSNFPSDLFIYAKMRPLFIKSEHPQDAWFNGKTFPGKNPLFMILPGAATPIWVVFECGIAQRQGLKGKLYVRVVACPLLFCFFSERKGGRCAGCAG